MSSSSTPRSLWQKAGWPALSLCLSLLGLAALWFWREPLQKRLHALSEGELSFSQPGLLVLLGILPLLLWGAGRSLTGLSLGQRLLSFALRSAFFVCLLLSLSRPLHEEESARLCQVVMVDVSQSVSDEDLTRFLQTFTELAQSKAADDELRLLAFAEEAVELSLQSDEAGKLVPPTLEALRASLVGDASDIEAAFTVAAALTRSDCVNRYLLASDGIETRGNALSASQSLKNNSVRLSFLPLDEASAMDVALLDVQAPSDVTVGQSFALRVELAATQATHGQLRLYQGEMLNGLQGARPVELTAGKNAFTFQSVVRVGGEVSYRAEFVPEEKDEFEQNNSFEISMDVPGPPRVLIVDRKPAQASYFAQALLAQQLDVDVRGPQAFPQSSAELSQFQFLVISDLARRDLSRGGEALVEAYVRAGGALLFAGGEAGYGPGGWQQSALSQILPVTMDAQKERETPGVAMALVIDRSGSMSGLPLAMAKEACIATLNVLEPSDLIEIIAFDSRPTSFVKLQPARYRSRIEQAVARIQPGGGTEIFNSLDMAYQSLAAVEARRKHIVLLTDGNAGSDGIYELASTAFAEGITITTVGLGGGVNGSLLAMIAESGGGRFHQAEDPSRLPRIFTRETELISKKATLDDWFPVSVSKNADFLKGISIGSAPFLRGYTSTQLKGPPAEMILQSDRGEPILARRPLGLGYTLAWTSDLKTRWATDWLRWRQFGQLFAQLVRAHLKSDDTKVRPMQVSLQGEEVVARVEAFDEAENFENDLHSYLEVQSHASASAKKEDKNSEEAEALGANFVALAPGLYEARVRLPGPGSYALKAIHQKLSQEGEKSSAGVSFGSISLPYPEEFRQLTPRLSSLRQLAQQSGGKQLKDSSQLWQSQGDRVITRKGRQSPFIILALVFFFLDLLVRRVRIFDRKFATRQGA